MIISLLLKNICLLYIAKSIGQLSKDMKTIFQAITVHFKYQSSILQTQQSNDNFVLQIKIMKNRKTATDSQSSIGQPDKNLAHLVENLREREFILKRDQIITSILEDVPKSFTKLISKDLMGGNFQSEEKIKAIGRNSNGNASEVRAKHAQKSFFKALEEEQRLISRENMQLLGLTIQKISYIPKSNKRKTGEIQDEHVETLQGCEATNLQNCQNIMESDKFLVRRAVSQHRSRGIKKRPQSIRVREKECLSPEKRRSSYRPISSEYQNPVYEARILSYRELLFKMQWSYGFYSEMDNAQELRSDQRYKAWIGGGNNSPLIKELIKRRFWWHIVDEKSNSDINFIWTQLKVPDYFKKQSQAPLWFMSEGVRKPNQVKDVPEKELSKELKKGRGRLNEREKESLKDEQYLYKIMPEFQRTIFQSAVNPFRGKDLYQRQRYMCQREMSSEGERVHNHLTANFHLGNKKALFYNLKQYYQLTGGNLFKAIPLTFHIKKGLKDPQYKRFLAYYKKREMHIKKQEKQMQKEEMVKRPLRNIWIVKPGELTNRGNGITVIDEVYELDSIIKSQKKHDNGTEKTFIVQLYIDRPLLYRRRKFDIRHYLMISQLHGVFKAFWFKQGYIRTSSYQFDVFNFDREIHLTNDAVQKYTPMYGRYEPANKVSYAEFQKYLDSTFKEKEKYNFEEVILPRMKEITLDAVRSTFVKLSPERLKHNFQIFGLDFMIDSEFVPWLIEVNTNPCLELACPLLTRIIPQMVDQALRLTLDVIYPPPSHYPNTAKHLVPDASLQSLKWQLIFDQRVEGQQLRQLYRHSRGDLLHQIGDVSDDELYQDSAPSNLPLGELL